MKKLSELAPKIVEIETGKKISFKEFLEDQSGNGELYSPLIAKMLTSASDPETGWIEADDLLVPIAREIILEAVQLENKGIYRKLVAALHDAWQSLCYQPEIAVGIAREYMLDESDPNYEAQAKALAEDIVYTKTVMKTFEPVPSGGFRAVVGYPLETLECDSNVTE